MSQYVTKVIEEDGEVGLLLTRELLNELNLREGQFLLWDVSNLAAGEIIIKLKFEEPKNETS